MVALFLALAQLLCMQVLQVLRCRHCVLLLPGPVVALYTLLTAGLCVQLCRLLFCANNVPHLPCSYERALRHIFHIHKSTRQLWL